VFESRRKDASEEMRNFLFGIALSYISLSSVSAQEIFLTCDVSGKHENVFIGTNVRQLTPEIISVTVLNSKRGLAISVQGTNDYEVNVMSKDDDGYSFINSSDQNSFSLSMLVQRGNVTYRNEVQLNRITGLISVTRVYATPSQSQTTSYSGLCKRVEGKKF
jgi:hypothetical protein